MRKILHIGNNVCGIPNALQRAERELGYESTVVSFTPDNQGHRSNYDYTEPSRIKQFFLTLQLGWSCDVFQFGGDTIFWGLDILFWKLIRKKVVVHYYGSEVRGKGPRFWHRFADVKTIVTPDLFDDVPDALWIPAPIFVEDYKPAIPKGTIIVHATTDREASGTKYIVDAFKRIKEEIPEAELDIVENVSHEEALERYRNATVVVDKLCVVGYMGLVGLESMAMGVPVVCWIKEDVKKHFHGNYPIWMTDTDRFEKDMILLLKTKSCQDLFKIVGKEYVANVHDPQRVVKNIMRMLK